MYRRRAAALLKASHPGPGIAVAALAGAYALSGGLGLGRTALVTAAVYAGQLSIGWCNDLVDADRDRVVGRRDKPIATGELPESIARTACGVALVATVVLSLACGIVAGLVHLGCVAAGWAYNLGVKASPLSWIPYVVAFGGLAVFVALAGPEAALPPWWLPTSTALLGVGAHLLNVLPDLAGDESTGVRGLAHRIGYRRASYVAVVSLAAASVVIALGADSLPGPVLMVGLATVAVLVGLALLTNGRTPFRAAIGIAAADVLMLVVAQ